MCSFYGKDFLKIMWFLKTPTNEESYVMTSLDKKHPAYHRNNYISGLMFNILSEHENHEDSKFYKKENTLLEFHL